MKSCGFRIPATIYRFIVSSRSHGCCSRPCVGLAIRDVIDVDEEISTEFCYTFRVQNPEKVSPAKEVRKLMRIQVLRCHTVYCQNGTKLIVIPFLASRSQALSVFLFGYHAPEYAMTGQLNAKSDVYSFGVVLLELLTRRKPVDHTLPRGQQSLVTWATPRLSEHKVKQCVDPRLNSEYPPKAIEKMADVAALCVQYEADFRPNMSIVVKALQPLLNT